MGTGWPWGAARQGGQWHPGGILPAPRGLPADGAAGRGAAGVHRGRQARVYTRRRSNGKPSGHSVPRPGSAPRIVKPRAPATGPPTLFSSSWSSTMRVAFIGLGVMGYPMAGHLAARGHEVTVYNRTPAKADAWVAQHGGKAAATPAQAAAGADVVCSCVGNDDDLRSVLTGPEGAMQTAPAGCVFVDHTTASANVARELYAAAAAHGLHFIDAPVSGGEAGAQKGILTIMCGGDDAPFQQVSPVLAAYGQAVTRVGESGAGQLAKMVNQISIAGLIQGLSEAIAFGERAGLDMQQVLTVISKGAAGSWQLENRGPTMLQDKFDFGFAVDWMRKDLGLCLDESRRNGATLPVTALVDQFYGDLQQMGCGRADTSSLVKRLRKR
jgi:3-hydroxyisobutyrate dehydrogenase